MVFRERHENDDINKRKDNLEETRSTKKKKITMES